MQKTSLDDPSDYEPKGPRLRPRNPFLSFCLGVFVSNLAGLGALGLVVALATGSWGGFSTIAEWTRGTLVSANFLAIPFGMGFIAAYFWQDLTRHTFGYTFINILVALFGAAFVLREGVICLIMASPLIVLLMGFGVSVGLHLWSKNTFLSVSVVPLLIVAIFTDASLPHHYKTQVSTEFHSSASPAALWRYTPSYPRNPHPANWWLWQMGLPMPMESQGKAVVGGRRDCELSQNVHIGEKIVVAQPNRRLEFVIDVQPQHPEIVNHFILERGRIELFPDGRGGTLLRGTSWYRLRVFPVNYFDWWARQVVHQTHRRVFERMDELARADEK